jgi:hypothetical protein
MVSFFKNSRLLSLTQKIPVRETPGTPGCHGQGFSFSAEMAFSAYFWVT